VEEESLLVMRGRIEIFAQFGVLVFDCGREPII
jgi:hypothetical protein